MNGLRIFNLRDEEGLFKDNVFYSQRSHGPIYRWHYEEGLAQWRGARMHNSEYRSQDLCAARWKSIPQKLQTQLGEHYLD